MRMTAFMSAGAKHTAMRILVRHLAAAVTALCLVRDAAAANDDAMSSSCFVEMRQINDQSSFK